MRILNQKQTLIYLFSHQMPKTFPHHRWPHLFILYFTLIQALYAIIQPCSQNTTSLTLPIIQDQPTCPPNSLCGPSGLCVCDLGFFGNCQTKGQFIDNQSKNFTINENYSFFIFQPIIDQFVNFQFIICNENSLDNVEIINMWVDQGNLTTPTSENALGRDKQLKVSQGCIVLLTSYYTFGLQPNGQKELVILGLRLRNPGTVNIQVLVQQISIFGFDVILKIIMVLIGGITVISLGGLFYCIYKCRRVRRRNTGLIEERFDISFFEELMPSKKANVQEMKQEICSVCLGEFKQNEQIRPTVCNHYFHKSCLDEWCVTNLSCPICRTSFEKANIIHEQYLMSRRNSTQQTSSIAEGCINQQQDLRQPIV